jgi:hypothetical protein
MKNSKIHEGFNKAEIRDLIADGFIEYHNGFNTINPNRKVYNSDDPFESRIINLQSEIAHQEAMLVLTKRANAFWQIMKMLGWEEFDVSDETIKEMGKSWKTFIGTEKEYKQLIEQIKQCS